MLEKMIYINNEYERLKSELEAIDQKMVKLKELGITSAQPYWMRQNDPTGKPDQLELTHSIKSRYYQQHGTRREYIGVNPDRITAALAAVDRYQQYSELRGQYRKLDQKIQHIEGQFKLLEVVVFGKQQHFWDK